MPAMPAFEVCDAVTPLHVRARFVAGALASRSARLAPSRASTGVYVTNSDRLGIRAAQELAKDVITSVDRVRGMGIKSLVIHSNTGDKKITMSTQEMEEIKSQARSYIMQTKAR